MCYIYEAKTTIEVPAEKAEILNDIAEILDVDVKELIVSSKPWTKTQNKYQETKLA